MKAGYRNISDSDFIKSSDTSDIELVRDKSDFNSKMLDCNMILPVPEHVKDVWMALSSFRLTNL